MSTSLKSCCAQLCVGVTSLSAVLSLVAVNPVRAVTFNVVGASWTDTIYGTGLPASLTGTVDIPIGTYSYSPNTSVSAPFTAFNLTLNVNGTASTRTGANIFTGSTSSLTLTASATDLKFISTSGADGSAAYLFFSGSDGDYIIGSDGNPGFQSASGSAGISATNRSFPTVFAVSSNTQSVPEPSTIPGLLLTGGSLLVLRRCYKKSPAQNEG